MRQALGNTLPFVLNCWRGRVIGGWTKPISLALLSLKSHAGSCVTIFWTTWLRPGADTFVLAHHWFACLFEIVPAVVSLFYFLLIFVFDFLETFNSNPFLILFFILPFSRIFLCQYICHHVELWFLGKHDTAICNAFLQYVPHSSPVPPMFQDSWDGALGRELHTVVFDNATLTLSACRHTCRQCDQVYIAVK